MHRVSQSRKLFYILHLTQSLVTFTSSGYIRYDTEDDDSEAGYQPRSINPTIGRRHSLAASHPRVRSNSIVLYNEDEDDVVFTSYGPIVIEDVGRDTGAAPARGRLVLGWCLALPTLPRYV